jgi:hypothetical protein
LKNEHKLKYTKKDLDEAKKYLIPIFDKPNQELIESLKLRFYNA